MATSIVALVAMGMVTGVATSVQPVVVARAPAGLATVVAAGVALLLDLRVNGSDGGCGRRDDRCCDWDGGGRGDTWGGMCDGECDDECSGSGS